LVFDVPPIQAEMRACRHAGEGAGVGA
jgi:hypothetical protein